MAVLESHVPLVTGDPDRVCHLLERWSEQLLLRWSNLECLEGAYHRPYLRSRLDELFSHIFDVLQELRWPVIKHPALFGTHRDSEHALLEPAAVEQQSHLAVAVAHVSNQQHVEEVLELTLEKVPPVADQ